MYIIEIRSIVGKVLLERKNHSILVVTMEEPAFERLLRVNQWIISVIERKPKKAF